MVGVRAVLEGWGDHTRGAASGSEQHEDHAGFPKKSLRGRKQRIQSLERELHQKKKEASQLSRELHFTRREGSSSELREHMKKVKSTKQEVFYLRNELLVARQGAEGEPGTGALPEFVIIGAPKCGTTFLYNLLVKHPHVEPAAFKELHYFDLLYDKGIEWYRRCFPHPRLKDGQKTITGEATPSYLSHPRAPERMAEIVSKVRLIALLRNPVDRAYSAYHFFGSRRGRNIREFEKHAEAALDDPRQKELSRGIYVDQLLRWAKCFEGEQMLVLKSEDFFENQLETLRLVVDFLGLPAWEPEASELRQKRNKGPYEQGMDQDTRQRLEEFYEPHNQRLYEYLGVDFGW